MTRFPATLCSVIAVILLKFFSDKKKTNYMGRCRLQTTAQMATVNDFTRLHLLEIKKMQEKYFLQC